MVDGAPDPLLTLRRSIASNSPPTPTTSAEAVASNATDNLALATYLYFSSPEPHSYPLSTPTRFISSKPVDLRSIYFAWQKKDVAIPDYIASAQQLNEELAGPDGAGGKVQNLVFVERLDLITWLEGASDESEYITPLDGDAEKAAASAAAGVASGAAGGAATAPNAGGRVLKTIDARLQEIYNEERPIANRNTVLRGFKPTDFSNVRKQAEAYLASNKRARPNPPNVASATSARPSTAVSSVPPSLPSHPKKSSRRPDPIILLSPSASSLLRMSNIKPFLESGQYHPPAPNSTTSILHISRLLPTIDPNRPLRFILVDSPEQFKPDYWDRVVAVLTTGQTWQFKNYKWNNAMELFKHAMGIYVGWKGDEVPDAVKGWGRSVVCVGVDKWIEGKKEEGRWRDREVVEAVWGHVEGWMKGRGWGAPAG